MIHPILGLAEKGQVLVEITALSLLKEAPAC